MAFNLYIQGDEGGYLPVESIPAGYTGPVFNGVWNGEEYNLVPIDPAIVSDPALQYGQQGSTEYQLATLGRLGGGLSNPASVAQYLKAVAPNFDWSQAIQNAYNQQVSQFGSGFVSGADDPAQTAIKIIEASGQPWAAQAEQYIRSTPQFAQSQAMGAQSQLYAEHQNDNTTFGIPNEVVSTALGIAGGPLGIMGLSTGTPILDTIINQAITQGITTGNIDPESLAKSAALGVAAPEFTKILTDAGLSPEVSNILTKTATGALSGGLQGALTGAVMGAAKQFGGPTLPQEQADYPIQDMGPMLSGPVSEAPVLTQPLQFASGYGGTSDVVPIVDELPAKEEEALIIRPGEEGDLASQKDQSITAFLSLNPGSETTPEGPNAALFGGALSGGGAAGKDAQKFSIFRVASDTYSIKDLTNDKVYTLIDFGGESKLIDNSTRLYVDLAPTEVDAIKNIVNKANESNLIQPSISAQQELTPSDIAIANEFTTKASTEESLISSEADQISQEQAPVTADVATGPAPVSSEETAPTAGIPPVSEEPAAGEQAAQAQPDQASIDKAVMDQIRDALGVPRETTVPAISGEISTVPSAQVLPNETGGMQQIATAPVPPAQIPPVMTQTDFVLPDEIGGVQQAITGPTPTAVPQPIAQEDIASPTPEQGTQGPITTQPEIETTPGTDTGTTSTSQENELIKLLFGDTTGAGGGGAITDTGTIPGVDISTAPTDTGVPGIMTPGISGGTDVAPPTTDIVIPGTDVTPTPPETVPTETVEPPLDTIPPIQEIPPISDTTEPTREVAQTETLTETTTTGKEPSPETETKTPTTDISWIFNLGSPITGTRYASLFERGQSGTAPAGTPGRAGAGELDPTRTGKKRQNVWNVSSLKNLQDALGI